MDAHAFRLMLVCWAFFVGTAALAQEPSPPRPAGEARAPSSVPGSISGRVLTDDGQPLANATIMFFPAGASRANPGPRNATADDEGNFRVTGLAPRSYRVNAVAPGYVLAPAPGAQGGAGAYYRAGDAVTLRLTKGGVITGRVTNAAGEPVVAVTVSAVLVRDAENRPVAAFGFGRARPTDDRGVYRLFGLFPGTYLVAADGNRQAPVQGSPYQGDVATYHPSATRDTAAEVKVQAGDEVTSVDIRYRGERGRAVSGTVTGVLDSRMSFGGINVMLLQVGTGSMLASTFVPPDGAEREFAIYGVPDGEYELVARRIGGMNEDGVISPPRRVTVRGADVTGVELALAPLASISGQLLLETREAAGQAGRCQAPRDAHLEEATVLARRDEKAKGNEWQRLLGFGLEAAASERGEFTIRNLAAGHHHILAQLPSEGWYVRSVTLPGQARRMIDVGRAGLTLKAGDRVTGVTVTAAEGAAGIRGRIVSPRDGGRLPSRLRVHLVPADPTAADDLLRYDETLAAGDGTFALRHLAPGRYWILARAVPDDEPLDPAARPAAWAQEGRAKLRAEAEASGTEISLERCRRVNDYTLRLGKA